MPGLPYFGKIHSCSPTNFIMYFYIKSKNIDIVFMQETHLLVEESKKLRRDWVDYVAASCGSRSSCGVATLVNQRLQFKCHTVRNVYAPKTMDPAFIGKLESKLVSGLGDFPILMGGDFNEVLDPILDRSTPTQHQTKACDALQDMCKSYGLVDIWRLHNPSKRDYTFYSSPHNSLSRIDVILVSNSLASILEIPTTEASADADVRFYFHASSQGGYLALNNRYFQKGPHSLCLLLHATAH
uniref:exodeoxyribonuclease III n=1 Tax=Amphiprion percula TaxID=161767 RepID=A0A3P8SB43_AMPPE